MLVSLGGRPFSPKSCVLFQVVHRDTFQRAVLITHRFEMTSACRYLNIDENAEDSTWAEIPAGAVYGGDKRDRIYRTLFGKLGSGQQNIHHNVTYMNNQRFGPKPTAIFFNICTM